MTLAGYIFANPTLGLVVAIIGIGLWIIALRRLGPLPLPRFRSLAAHVGAVCLAMALGLLAAHPMHPGLEGRRAVLLLVDQSASAVADSEQVAKRAWNSLREALEPEDLLAAASFAADFRMVETFKPSVQQPPNLVLPPPAIESRTETRLAAALRAAQMFFPPGASPQIVLLSDGGGAEFASVLPLGTAVLRLTPQIAQDVALTALHLSGGSGPAGTGATVELVATSTAPISAELVIQLDEIELSRHSLDLPAGQLPIGIGLDRLPEPGSQITATIESQDDGLPGNQTLTLSVPRLGRPPRVLMIDGSDDLRATRPLSQALAAGGLTTKEIAPSAMPHTKEGLDQYDAVLLSDVAADELAPEVHALLERWVLAGGGLGMIGSPESFAPGGWYGTDIERILPLDSRHERSDDDRIAVVVVLDVSGSMGRTTSEGASLTKMDAANRGVEYAMRMVMDGDLFGVLATNMSNNWIVRLSQLTDRGRTTRAIHMTQSGGGGIALDTAMSEAAGVLREATAARKFLLVFADGNDVQEWQVKDSSRVPKESWDTYTGSLLEKYNITTSTISIGEGEFVPRLKRMANSGGGRALETESADELPLLFSREVAEFSGGYLSENLFRPEVSQQGLLVDDIPWDSAPFLQGHVLTTPKPTATVWLTAGPEVQDRPAAPLMATARAGLGRTLAFTSDARDRWASNWLAWEGYSKAWQRWGRWLATGGAFPGAADVSVTFGEAVSELQLQHAPLEQASIRAVVWSPNGSSRATELDRTGAGSARLQFSSALTGLYRFDFWAEVAGSDLPIALGHATASRVPREESKVTHPKLDQLVASAVKTGGGLINNAAQALALAPPPRSAPQSASGPPVAFMVCGLFLLAFSRRFPAWPGSQASAAKAQNDAILKAWSTQRVRKPKRDPVPDLVMTPQPKPERTYSPPSDREAGTSGGSVASRLADARRRR